MMGCEMEVQVKHHYISGEEKLITKIKGEILNKSNLIRFIYVFKLTSQIYFRTEIEIWPR